MFVVLLRTRDRNFSIIMVHNLSFPIPSIPCVFDLYYACLPFLGPSMYLLGSVRRRKWCSSSLHSPVADCESGVVAKIARRNNWCHMFSMERTWYKTTPFNELHHQPIQWHHRNLCRSKNAPQESPKRSSRVPRPVRNVSLKQDRKWLFLR